MEKERALRKLKKEQNQEKDKKIVKGKGKSRRIKALIIIIDRIDRKERDCNQSIRNISR